MRGSNHGRWTQTLALVGVAIMAVAFAPRWIAACDARRFYDGELETTDALAREVAREAMRDEPAVSSGSSLADGEWSLVTEQMTILGLGQFVHEHPTLRGRYVPVMNRAARRMMAPRMRAFATRAWQRDGVEHLDDDRGDAWIGWPALALAVLHATDPDTPFAALDDRIAAALARRLARAPFALIETYPGQSFPTDVAACAAAVAENARTSGRDRGAMLARWMRRYRERWIDARSGLLWQQGGWLDGAGRDAPRGSGTAVAAYFASFIDPSLADTLVAGLVRNERSFAGFGAIREYARGREGHGDVDSGPVLLGVSVTATGFALGAARATRARELFLDVYRTTSLFGMRTADGDRTVFAMGGRFGNAVMLAQLTANGLR